MSTNAYCLYCCFSLVLAAYASFLWETGEDDEEDNAERNSVEMLRVHAAMTSASS